MTTSFGSTIDSPACEPAPAMSVAAAIALKSLPAGTYCLVVLRGGAALLSLVIVAGCGSSIAGNEPEPAISRYLVTRKASGLPTSTGAIRNCSRQVDNYQ
jgi:hypothetical protein